MNSLRFIRDEAKKVWRSITVEELREMAESDELFKPNREMRRAEVVAMRRRGAGYTRPFRKGRRQRHMEEA